MRIKVYLPKNLQEYKTKLYKNTLLLYGHVKLCKNTSLLRQLSIY